MNPRRLFHIASWELRKDSGFLSRDTLILVVLSLVVVGGVVAVVGVSPPDENLYTVGVASDSAYHDAFAEHDSLRVVPPDEEQFHNGNLDVLVTEDGSIYAADTATGRAASNELTDAVRQYNTRLMSEEADTSAAFPVAVSVEYVTPKEQKLAFSDGAPAPDTTDNDGTTETDSGVDSTNDDSTSDDSNESSTGDNSSTDDGQTDSTAGTDESKTDDGTGTSGSETDSDSGTATDESGSFGQSVGFAEDETLPSELVPPLPFESLLVAFALLIPLNFISQVYASSMVAERTKRRGEMLLVSPATRYEIVGGKTLPYFVIASGIIAGALVAVGASWVSIAGILPLAMAFLALSFLASSFARSYKELSFFTLGVSVLLTTYAFIPAIFTQVHPISAISPLSIVVADLQGAGFDTARVLMGTVPLFVTSAIVFVFGIETYEEEFLFAQVSLPKKVLLMLSAQIHSPRSAFVLGALSIPFVFVAELLVLAGLIAVPQLISVPLLLVIIAFIEEVGKSLPVYAGFRMGRLSLSWRTAAVAGALSGFGFFVAEKVTVISQQVGIHGLEMGELAFGTALSAGGGGSPLGMVILGLWPLLHSITTVISCVGARKGRTGYIVGLVLATVVHVGYNLTAVMLYA